MGEREETLGRLEARIRALEDAEAIRRLKARYAERVDARYAGGEPVPSDTLQRLASEIATLFAADAEWDGGPGLGLCRGRDAIRERLATPTLRFSRHYFVSPLLVVEGDTARGRWELLAPCTTHDGRQSWLVGVEDDEYVREGGVWLHRRMALTVIGMRRGG